MPARRCAGVSLYWPIARSGDWHIEWSTNGGAGSRRVIERAAGGVVPITRAQLEQYEGFFDAPQRAEIDLFDMPKTKKQASPEQR